MKKKKKLTKKSKLENAYSTQCDSTHAAAPFFPFHYLLTGISSAGNQSIETSLPSTTMTFIIITYTILCGSRTILKTAVVCEVFARGHPIDTTNSQAVHKVGKRFQRGGVFPAPHRVVPGAMETDRKQF